MSNASKRPEERLLVVEARLAELERLREEMEGAKAAVRVGKIIIPLGGGVVALAEIKKWLVDAGGVIYIESPELLERRLQRVNQEKERLLKEREKLLGELKGNAP